MKIMKYRLRPIAPSVLAVLTGTIAGLGISKGAIAADHLNLEEGLPAEVEDAYPLGFGGFEFQGIFHYDRVEGEDIFTLDPRLEWGFARNWQAKLSVPVVLGSEENDIGDISAEVFYNFNTETLSTPAIALSASADFPTVSDSKGVDPTLKLLVTKSIGTGKNLDRLHLNLGWTYNSKKQDNERQNALSAALGYSRRLGSETILVSDIVFEQEKEEDAEMYLIEIGVRHQLSPLNVLAIGAGVGLGEESPDLRITAGFQQSF
jgi:hypothetical protein